MSGITLCPGGEAERSVTALVVRTSAASSGEACARAHGMRLRRPLNTDILLGHVVERMKSAESLPALILPAREGLALTPGPR